MTYDWDKYEAEIRHYYREEHWTSEEVRDYINHHYGVNIQSRTLRHKLKEWGIRRVDTKNERNISWRGVPSPAPVAYSQTGFASSATVVCPEHGSVGPAPVVYPENGSAGPAPVVYSQADFASSALVVYPGSLGPAPVIYSQTGFASAAPVIYPENGSAGPARMVNHAGDGSTQLQPGTGMGYMPVQSLQNDQTYLFQTPQPRQATHPQSLTSLFPSTRAQGVVEPEARPETPNWGLYQDDGKLAVNIDNYTALSDIQASQNHELTVSMEQVHASNRPPLVDLTTSHSIANNPCPPAYTLPSSTTSDFIPGPTDPDVFQNGDDPAPWNAVQLWGRFPDSWSC